MLTEICCQQDLRKIQVGSLIYVRFPESWSNFLSGFYFATATNGENGNQCKKLSKPFTVAGINRWFNGAALISTPGGKIFLFE
jgi:hypothetical protein